MWLLVSYERIAIPRNRNMSIESFEEMYIDELRDLYSAETQLLEALPKVIEAATNSKLIAAIEAHLNETQHQVQRLESLFRDLDEEPHGHTCRAMQGLIKEAKEAIDDIEEGPLLDAALIIAAQKVEHYEIAGYGSLKTLAGSSGYKQHVGLLEDTLTEEKGADHKLTEIAESIVNEQAIAQS